MTTARRCGPGGRLSPGLMMVMLLLALPAAAGDWPQFRGPTHDSISSDRIVRQWSGAVTNPVWRVPLGYGLGSLAVQDARVFTQVRRWIAGTNLEVCVALSAPDGTELWATPVDLASYPDSGVGPDDGPRTTPSADGDSVYVLSSYLKLYRLNVTSGAVIWRKDLLADYGGYVIAWQNAASPPVENGLIYVNANCGSRSLLALRTSDGSLAWRAEDEAMTHATPALATIHGVRQVIFPTQSGLVALDALTGARLWRHFYPFYYATALAPSPVVWSDMVFQTSHHGYGMGSVAIQVGPTNDTTRLWWTNNPASHWMTPVCHEGFLYGQFGIQFSYDSTNAQLKCIDLRTGVVRWSVNGFGRGGTLLVDHHILTLTEIGDLVLVQPDPDAYTELARFRVIPDYDARTNKCWNLPAVADGLVYVRSTSQAACYDLSVPALQLAAPSPPVNQEMVLTVQTATGAPLHAERAASLEVRATTNLALPVSHWTPLTNDLVLTNGTVRIEKVDARPRPGRYFIVSEPK